MRCLNCEHFKIAYQPMMPWDMGLAECKKHDLECDFSSKRKLNRLVCVEETNDEKRSGASSR